MLDLALFDGGVNKLEYSAQKVGPNVADSKKSDDRNACFSTIFPLCEPPNVLWM